MVIKKQLFLWLYILFGGVTAQLSDITSCEGDTVTFTCTVDAIGHTWNISSAGTLTTTRADPTTSSPPFTAQIVDDNNDMINSTLTFVSFAGINESVISCTDANAAVGEGETQEAMAFVYGPPSAPELTIVATDLMSLNFTITPPSYAGQCVLNYTITATDNNGSVLTDIIAVSDGGEAVTVTETGFDLCNDTYNFTVVANTLTYTGNRSVTFNPETLDFAPEILFDRNGFNVTVTGVAPEFFTDYNVSIWRSYPNGNCNESSFGSERIFDEVINGSSPVTLTDMLRCRYDDNIVTYCLQFTTEECQSEVAMETISLPPSLLLSVQAERISSSSVNVVVDVDQDADCVGPLTMNALIANSSSGNFSRQSEDFADTTFEYQSLSPETYTVVIEIRDDVSFVVARDEVSFTVTSRVPVGAIVGGVVGGSGAVLLLVVTAILVTVLATVIKKKKASAAISFTTAGNTTKPEVIEVEDMEQKRNKPKFVEANNGES